MPDQGWSAVWAAVARAQSFPRGRASAGLCSACGCACQQREHFAGDVALEAAHDLGLGLAFGGAAGDVVLGGLMAAHADQGDAPQGAVGLAVAAAVQPVPVGAAGGDGYRGGSAEPGEGGFRAQPVRVVPGGDQELPGGVHADAGQRDEFGSGGGDQRGELRVQVVDLGLRRLPAAGQGTQRSWLPRPGRQRGRGEGLRRRGSAA